MKKNCLVLLLCLGSILLHAQSRCNINKAWAYYTVSYPGMQMADENGNPIPPKPIIDRFIYIEWCGSKKPDIKEVLYNGREYEAVLEKVTGRSVVPGKDLSPENKTRITAARCKQLWKLTLLPKGEAAVPEPGGKQVIIKIKLHGKCVYRISRESKLITLPRP
jgi:hypothetical protein